MAFPQAKEGRWAEAGKGKERHRGLSDSASAARQWGVDSGTQPVSMDLQGSATTDSLRCLYVSPSLASIPVVSAE